MNGKAMADSDVCPGEIFGGVIGQNPSVSKSNWLRAMIFSGHLFMSSEYIP